MINSGFSFPLPGMEPAELRQVERRTLPGSDYQSPSLRQSVVSLSYPDTPIGVAPGNPYLARIASAMSGQDETRTAFSDETLLRLEAYGLLSPGDWLEVCRILELGIDPAIAD
jgi:hypothetical protein